MQLPTLIIQSLLIQNMFNIIKYIILLSSYQHIAILSLSDITLNDKVKWTSYSYVLQCYKKMGEEKVVAIIGWYEYIDIFQNLKRTSVFKRVFWKRTYQVDIAKHVEN